MLRQVEQDVQNEPITKSGVLLLTIYFFWKFNFSIRTSDKYLIYSNVPITQMSIFILFISAWVIFEGMFSLRVSPHKKWSFTLKIYLVNVTKSAGNCRFGHIYWRNP